MQLLAHSQVVVKIIMVDSMGTVLKNRITLIVVYLCFQEQA